MLYKTRNIKYSFLAAGIAYLLSSSAIAQNKLLLLDEDANSSIGTEDSGDELNLSLDDDLSNDPLQDDNNNGGVAPQVMSQSQPAPAPAVMSMPAPAPMEENIKFAAPQKEDNRNNAVLNAYRNFTDEVDRQNFNNLGAENDSSALGDRIMNQVKEDLFSQMADIEKQTSLLTLELKREKIKNEIAAMKAQRQRAIEAEIEKQKEKERKQAEWEKEQERRLLEDQQKLKEMEIKYEKLRQERVLKAYKESMLKSNQEWVDYNSRLYNQLVKEEKAYNDLRAKQKDYFKNLNAAIVKAGIAAQSMKERYDKEISTLQTQVALLKSKLEAEKTAFEESKKTGPNPFAMIDDENGPKKKIAEEYAIMEISGKGDKLVAKLINKNGGTFMVKPGTILNTGHIIEEITQTYITTDKSGIKDYLYFSAGGILDKEPSKPLSSVSHKENEDTDKVKSVTTRIPSLREGMFVE